MWTFSTMKTYPRRQRFHNGSIGKTKEKRLPGTKTYMNVNNILALLHIFALRNEKTENLNPNRLLGFSRYFCFILSVFSSVFLQA